MYQLVFYVPESHLNIVKDAIFLAGAGRYQNYDNCSWQTIGEGQFRPVENSQPYIGTKGVVETVNEYRVETMCQSQYLNHVLSALREVHPYEEPAYHYYEACMNDHNTQESTDE